MSAPARPITLCACCDRATDAPVPTVWRVVDHDLTVTLCPACVPPTPSVSEGVRDTLARCRVVPLGRAVTDAEGGRIALVREALRRCPPRRLDALEASPWR